MNKTAILFCQCRDVPQNQFHSDSARQLLTGMDVSVFVLDDLCSIALHEKSFLREIENEYPNKIVMACYPRVVENLFLQNEISFSNFKVINFHDLKSADQLRYELSCLEVSEGEASFSTVKSSLGVPSWFPVIDQSRCTHCGKCARIQIKN